MSRCISVRMSVHPDLGKSLCPYLPIYIGIAVLQYGCKSVGLDVCRSLRTVQRNYISTDLQRNPCHVAANVCYPLRHASQSAEKFLSDYIMLKVRPAVNADLCSRKQSSGSDERVGKTDMCAVEATNPSARRIMYARRSIARCLLSYSKGFGLPAKLPSCPCRGPGSDSEVVIP